MRKLEFIHVMMGVMALGAILICFVSGVAAGFFYAVMSAGSFVSINLMMDLLHSVFTERIYRRDRLLSEYVPAREGNVWLTLGVTALFVWGAYGYANEVSHAPGIVMWVWVVPALLVGTVVPYVRARVDAKAFRRDVEAARDVSLDRKFWEIVNNDREA